MPKNFAGDFMKTFLAMANVQDEELVEEFDIFGVELTDADISDKLKELCAVHRCTAEKIASEWAAYSHTRGTVAISLAHLDTLDKQMSNKKSGKSSKTPARKPTRTVYSADDILDAMSPEAEDELVDAYCTPKHAQKGQKRQITPEVTNRKRVTDLARNSAAPFSPSSFSPAGTTPSKYTSRSNAGDVIASYGEVSGVNWTAERRACTVMLHDEATLPEEPVKYMYEKITDKIQVLDGLIEDMANCLREHHRLEHLTPAALPMQEEASVVCRVGCDSEGKLNAKSVVLEDSMDMSGRHVPLDVSGLNSYSLFPGQVIAVDGLNTSGQKFVAKKIHAGVPPSLPTSNLSGDDVLNVLISCGPYTTSDSLVYEPLEDLKKCIRAQKPNVCILMGPFVDAANENFENGYIEETFEDIFKSLVSSLVKETARFSTQLILVPSQRDLHHECVYPQPPYSMEKMERVHLMMDPCVLDIDGVVFGLTSTDILFQLGCEEISNFPPGSSDRMARLIHHLLCQRSFYPLYPPSLDICLDYEMLDKYGRLNVTPHVLVTPSDLKQFIKEVDGCCCVNPGKLTKGLSGGSYCRLVVRPGSKERLSPSTQLAAQVLKI